MYSCVLYTETITGPRQSIGENDSAVDEVKSITVEEDKHTLKISVSVRKTKPKEERKKKREK